ncbi:cobalt-zinc-cadmium efflux system membrane fusion protein [Sphingobium sp. OAS761]|uniref:efflux RND transporter periplasmic adaptor subunit n=1 Tax=Sphingobium sp. OAS761 TaxID=2817901 RepID=UPI00209CABBD|nr:efflux RND transporter periplasmic adaptor subunit [Sphingobium sp. OAS761]MCP1471992.1 cobalt-zinc-cadmium efflux system membrane fusion protein [Sphingobium sp. OAS761]
MKFVMRAIAPAALGLLLTACGGDPAEQGHAKDEAHAGEERLIRLTPQQIAAARIEVARPDTGGAGAITLPATIEGDPQGTQVVSAAIGGRVVSLTRNLGQSVGRGETLAVIESREAATLKAEVEAARARLALAQSNLRREQRLFAERVSPEQDLIAARTAATEASIALRLAQQQVSAAGGGGGGLNRLAIAAPLSGQVIARSVTLGQTVAADAELFRVANLSQLSVRLSLSPADAGRVTPGSAVTISAPGRKTSARVSFVSPVLDETTRLVPVVAIIDNRASQWRVGEPVTAAISVAGGTGGILVPGEAVQTVEGRPTVFVRVAQGFKATPVTLGQPSGEAVTILSGLTGREQIAVTNSFTLKAELGKGEASHED